MKLRWLPVGERSPAKTSRRLPKRRKTSAIPRSWPALVERGQHRSVGVADLLLAATAEIERLTVLHYDADFDLIAEITGQPTEWIVPRGSIP